MPALLRPVRRVEVGQLPGQRSGIVLPEPLPEPVARQAEAAIPRMPGPSPADVGRPCQNRPGGFRFHDQGHAHGQGADHDQHSLRGHVPHLTGLPLPAADVPTIAARRQS